jgi:sugar-specific transcriptional regulator TrmB
MASEDDFIPHLMGFGLTEKEAECYFYLLKYGPKTPSPLAKSLKTYREDAHRTLTALIDKGMVRPSLDSPTLYTAVELDEALESAVKKRESELRDMEQRKRQLEELARQQRFRPSDDVTTFKIIKSVKELLAVAIPQIESMQYEWFIAAPATATVVASLFGVNEAAREFIKRGGKVRCIVDISYQVIEPVREMIAIGEEVRHIDRHGIMFVIFDRKKTMNAINVDLKNISLNEPLSILWSDDPRYAEYLATT